MKTKRNNKLITLILSMMLVMALTLCTTGCGNTSAVEPSTTEASVSENPSTSSTAEGSAEENAALKNFTFTVVDKEGNETVFDIETDKETVGEALLEQGLIAGEEGQYGLYVKTVNGITADYDVDGTYWAFYINEEYATTTGVDSTPITEGETYSFKVE